MLDAGAIVQTRKRSGHCYVYAYIIRNESVFLPRDGFCLDDRAIPNFLRLSTCHKSLKHRARNASSC